MAASGAVTAFDMEEEKDEGHFDADGNFVWDDEAKKVQEEAWLDGVSEQQMGAAKSAKSRREFRDEQAEETLTTETANRTLAALLKPRETVLRALKRLGSKKPARVRPGSKRKQAQRSETQPAQTAEEKKQFEQVTEAADFLMRSGEVDVYSQIKEEFVPEEQLVAQRRRVQFAEEEEGKSEENPPKQEVMWEYKATDGHIHGPFPTSSFVAWQQQGYFKGETAVDMRQVRSSDDVGGEVKQEANKKQKQEPEKLPAEQELLNDFEDSDNEDDNPTADDKEKADENPWKRSDAIDFSSY
ncbi:CD2 antigen cytoplasmic tail-binding protein 2 [Phytophthora pseudosyringae]|uniref:CD2 antigen cytoplasmic tail-binding protein 2 n=1 Tax=Phytophthora pseudosyringae TaxID=221518 RepID=A0A8T1VD02_9STRA|nr:CD2 antigen cytoplasmic tail-binding protein 2 [Phytophthora pseudosyringae]